MNLFRFVRRRGKDQVTCINLLTCTRNSDGICSFDCTCIVSFYLKTPHSTHQTAMSVILRGGRGDAKQNLFSSGFVDGCIHRAAGHYLYEECHSLNGCETGKAKITCGYDLPAKYVIHTVGPIARGNVGPVQREDLASCYKSSLKLVKDYSLRSVIDRIIFCVFLENDYGIYNRKMSDYFPTDNEECEEGNEAHTEDDANQNDTDDVYMESQPDQDVEMFSQADVDEDRLDTPNLQPVEDEKAAGDGKPQQEKEKHEEKKSDSEEGAGVEKETSAGEKSKDVPADTKQEDDEEDQVTSINSKQADGQESVETMEVEATGGANARILPRCFRIRPPKPSTQPFLTPSLLRPPEPSTLLTLSPGRGLNRQPLNPELLRRQGGRRLNIAPLVQDTPSETVHIGYTLRNRPQPTFHAAIPDTFLTTVTRTFHALNFEPWPGRGLATSQPRGAATEENTTRDITKSEGEVKHQDKSPAETNQATQTDISQSKDGSSSDKGEPSKE
ncbi:O-acetyl-ADP-ribose deacetylase MACROD2 isoform X1 [Silurus meridionalis]|nr:O-acetyl-ADP-ribose deacetylase MACROD2 isoform X1 [Silurus meridionalis]